MARKWTQKEDQLIVDFLVNTSKTISKKLPGRSDLAVKQRVYALLGKGNLYQPARKAPLSSPQSSNFRNVRSGFRKDLNILVRSGWESNFLRYLNYLKTDWEYEPEVFPLVCKTASAYCPDVHIKDYPGIGDMWIEIKGRVSSGTFTKMNAFKKQYPDVFEKMYGVCEKNTPADRLFKKLGIPILFYYKDFRAGYKHLLPGWEGI